MNQKNIAIFGSTGHIGKNLVSFLSNDSNFKLFLFSRDAKKFESLKKIIPDSSLSFNSYEDFEKNEYNTIINCIGIGNPIDFTNKQSSILDTTEFYDNKIINYVKKFPMTCYINLSSGAIFGQDFTTPVNDSSFSKLDINKPNQGYLYTVSKIYSEAKHRSLSDLDIMDLRIFGFFSRFIDLNGGFFMSELIKAIKNNSEFITDEIDMMRDYVSPSDFYALIKNCILNKNNDAYDVYSKEPISKFKILQELSSKFDLRFIIKEKIDSISPTGFKQKYYSLSKKAEKINYFPKFSSLETILNESSLILKTN
jgi:nucleoside-diphosphate-sugar epimerase